MTAHTLNRRLAELTGWSNITELGGALLGTPPAGEPQCHGQAKVPDWEGDWRACGPLMVKYLLNRSDSLLYVVPLCNTTLWVELAGYVGSDAATRQTIAAAIIAKLEAGQ